MMPWGPSHLAILKLLLGNLPHIVITVWFVGVFKDDGTTCKGQSLKSYLFKKILQTNRIHKYIYIQGVPQYWVHFVFCYSTIPKYKS